MVAESPKSNSLAPSHEEPPVCREELVQVFAAAEVEPDEFRIGAEEEKFGVLRPERTPLPYAGPRGVAQVLAGLAEQHGWEAAAEFADGPVIALKLRQQSITLEPGAQLELSGAPLPDLHAIRAEKLQHLQELLPLSSALGISWHSVGFHPTARQAELPWVPKTRYPIMKSYLPGRGNGALDMMRRTATVQANYDYKSERDALRKLVVALKLSPLIHALLANSPFYEGASSGKKSLRGDVWRRMDPSRSGLIPVLWNNPQPGYEDYVEWSLDAGMFLIWRDGEAIKNTGQTFRDFLEHGYQGHRATLSDYRLHLSTLFPEIRLKNTLEVRPCDALPIELSLSALGLWTGILYGEEALRLAEDFCAQLDSETIEQARPELTARGLHAPLLKDQSTWALGEQLFEIARRGLIERARGEERYLGPIAELLETRKCPADLLLEEVQNGKDVLSATELQQLGSQSPS